MAASADHRRAKPRKTASPSAFGRDAEDVARIGFENSGWRDTYHFLMTIPILALLLLLAGTWIAANGLFACLYLCFPEDVAHARPGSFADAFFFSVQTMATIGYGDMYPQTLAANLIATAETVYGMMTMALSTGLLFARVSRPTARMTFSHIAVVDNFGGAPHLMFRVANQRRNQIVEAQMRFYVLRSERSAEGHVMRRFHDLTLVRDHTPVFALTWTVMHRIDEASPLHDVTPEMMELDDMSFVCTMTGTDETFAQTVYARYAYNADTVRWNARFADIFTVRADGRRAVDYTRFHDVAE
ncbi:MAG TPA: ion channel [Aliidongia sp.]|uniref:ion channel n=1 Tax=Aliidongia sp. TaxID=1914230 RepID=UPI002DDCABEC|nr:ion channel [Aliidongia sp.]HEV2678159.1 ion channel [Aliidongia sp.]